MKIAVITGASSGIGREFARALDAENKADLFWLIARREDALRETAAMLKTECRILPMDLTKANAVSEYAAMLAKENAEVVTLVNAGGFGKFTPFSDVPFSAYKSMIDLNDTALTEMTYATLPFMKRGARIFQMGSLSSFQPVPNLAIYAATKAYVLSFSRALNAELAPKGIRVCCVCPGWVRTAFFDRADLGNGAITYFNRFTTPDKVAKKAIKDMDKGKDVSIEGFSVRAQVLLVKLLPHRLVMKIWMKQQKML